jgi:hypothetical protein
MGDGQIALGVVSSGVGCNTYYQHIWDAGHYFGVWIY